MSQFIRSADGRLTLDSQVQWQPTFGAHDPNPPLPIGADLGQVDGEVVPMPPPPPDVIVAATDSLPPLNVTPPPALETIAGDDLPEREQVFPAKLLPDVVLPPLFKSGPGDDLPEREQVFPAKSPADTVLPPLFRAGPPDDLPRRQPLAALQPAVPSWTPPPQIVSSRVTLDNQAPQLSRQVPPRVPEEQVHGPFFKPILSDVSPVPVPPASRQPAAAPWTPPTQIVSSRVTIDNQLPRVQLPAPPRAPEEQVPSAFFKPILGDVQPTTTPLASRQPAPQPWVAPSSIVSSRVTLENTATTPARIVALRVPDDLAPGPFLRPILDDAQPARQPAHRPRQPASEQPMVEVVVALLEALADPLLPRVAPALPLRVPDDQALHAVVIALREALADSFLRPLDPLPSLRFDDQALPSLFRGVLPDLLLRPVVVPPVRVPDDLAPRFTLAPVLPDGLVVPVRARLVVPAPPDVLPALVRVAPVLADEVLRPAGEFARRVLEAFFLRPIPRPVPPPPLPVWAFAFAGQSERDARSLVASDSTVLAQPSRTEAQTLVASGTMAVRLEDG